MSEPVPDLGGIGDYLDGLHGHQGDAMRGAVEGAIVGWLSVPGVLAGGLSGPYSAIQEGLSRRAG
jgi:hypothetical protein